MQVAMDDFVIQPSILLQCTEVFPEAHFLAVVKDFIFFIFFFRHCILYEQAVSTGQCGGRSAQQICSWMCRSRVGSSQMRRRMHSRSARCRKMICSNRRGANCGIRSRSSRPTTHNRWGRRGRFFLGVTCQIFSLAILVGCIGNGSGFDRVRRIQLESNLPMIVLFAHLVTSPPSWFHSGWIRVAGIQGSPIGCESLGTPFSSVRFAFVHGAFLLNPEVVGTLAHKLALPNSGEESYLALNNNLTMNVLVDSPLCPTKIDSAVLFEIRLKLLLKRPKRAPVHPIKN